MTCLSCKQANTMPKMDTCYKSLVSNTEHHLSLNSWYLWNLYNWIFTLFSLRKKDQNKFARCLNKEYLSSCAFSVDPETWRFHIKFVFVFVFVFHSSVAATQMSERMMSPVVYKQLIQVQLIHSGRAFASKRKQRSHRCALAPTSHQRIKFYWQLTNASVQWQICQFQSQERLWSASADMN